MEDILKIIQDESLTYQQRMLTLAQYAENQSTYLRYSDETYAALNKDIICDLGEGKLPFRPRYIVVDFQKLLHEGCLFLELEKADDLQSALTHLLIMYRHIPSVTSFPVYLGALDELLEEYVIKEDYNYAKKCIKLFLKQIDRTLTDSFVHANIGPYDTVTGRIILELTQEMKLAVPNISLKYDPDITSDEYAKKCVECMLISAKPSFANHKMFVSDWGEDYAIASCYNGLLNKGGGFTLSRLKLYNMALEASSYDEFINHILPYYLELMWNMMETRIRFIVEESAFFKSNFLVKEEFVHLDNFTGMFGVVGLAQCVNHLLNIQDPYLGYGYNKDAEKIGIEIIEAIEAFVNTKESKYCASTNHHYRLHAQVGISSDGKDNAPGCRIPVGYEPDLFEHLSFVSKFHKYFPTGIGDIFKFEKTWLNTPDALIDIIKGAMNNGLRYFSGYLEDNDVVRVTGYLVKKSELEKLDAKKQSLNNVSIFGQGARDHGKALERRIYESKDQ